MKAKSLMTKSLIVAKENNDIYTVSNIMKENDIGFLPIADNNNKIIGVITDRDIIVKIIANKDTKIKNYITKNIIYCNINDTIDNILSLLTKYKIKRLLVEDSMKLVGIISISDILNTEHNDKDKLSIIKNIWSITKNAQKDNLEIDEFYL